MIRASTRRAEAPPRLGTARPRHVGLTGGGKALAALSIALLAAAPAAGVLIGSAAGRQAVELRLLEEGREAQGSVARLWRTRGEKAKHWVAYDVQIEGRAYSRQTAAPVRVWRKLQVGSPIAIRYAAADPELQQPRDWDGRRPLPPWLAPLVAAALAAVGGLALVPIRSQRRLLAEGRATAATVTAHAKADHGQKTAHYTFQVLSGATRTGKSGPTKKPPVIGSSLTVLYDSENPSRSALYPFSLVELRR